MCCINEYSSEYILWRCLNLENFSLLFVSGVWVWGGGMG